MKATLGNLQPMDPRDIWPDEAHDFTPWLALPENLARLSETLDLELELEGIEVPVGSYKADIVANDTASNERVIIENQLEKTNHDHLGKILTYASGLKSNTLIWIAREFTEEHRQAIDFLNDHAAPSLRLYALEVQVFRIADSVPAPFFRIVASPNEYSASIPPAGGEFTQTQPLYLEFWNDFREHCKSHTSPLKPRKPRPQHWITIASTMHRRIGCEIYIRGTQAK